jgi:hypothetical protein
MTAARASPPPENGADRLRDQPGQDVVGAAGGAAAPRHRGRIGLQLLDQLAKVLDVGRLGNDDHFIFAGQARDRCGLLQGHRGLVGQDRAHHDQAVDHQRLAITLLAIRQLGKADRPSGAGDILHRHRLGDAGALHHLLHGAGGLVPAAAGLGRGDDLEIVQREGAGRGAQPGHQGDRADELAKCGCVHSFLPWERVGCAAWS